MDDPCTLYLAGPDDEGPWMELVTSVKENFPGLETPEALEDYRRTLLKNIARGTALCAGYGGVLAGVLLFTVHTGCLSFLAVHPAFRRQGINRI